MLKSSKVAFMYTYFIKIDKRNGCEGRMGETAESGITVKPQIPSLWLPDLIVQRYSRRLWDQADLDLNLNFSVPLKTMRTCVLCSVAYLFKNHG